MSALCHAGNQGQRIEERGHPCPQCSASRRTHHEEARKMDAAGRAIPRPGRSRLIRPFHFLRARPCIRGNSRRMDKKSGDGPLNPVTPSNTGFWREQAKNPLMFANVRICSLLPQARVTPVFTLMHNSMACSGLFHRFPETAANRIFVL